MRVAITKPSPPPPLPSRPSVQVIHDHAVNIALALPRSHWPTVVTAAICIGLLVAWSKTRYATRLPAPLLLVVVAIVVFVSWMRATGDDGESALPSRGYANFAGIRLIGKVPSAFPTPALPPLGRFPASQLLTTAVTVMFVGFVESVAVAKTYALKHQYEVSGALPGRAGGMVGGGEDGLRHA
jgi:MFS superfamily sulfate permease-like transporter